MRLWNKEGEVELSTDSIAALQTRWKTKAVQAELQAMHLWLQRYPKRRPANIWRFMDCWLKKAPNVRLPPPTIVYGWWTSDERTIQQGHSIGLSARPGESMAQFRERIGEAMRKSA